MSCGLFVVASIAHLVLVFINASSSDSGPVGALLLSCLFVFCDTAYTCYKAHFSPPYYFFKEILFLQNFDLKL